MVILQRALPLVPLGQLRLGVDLIRVAEPRVVEVMTDTGHEEDGEFPLGEDLAQLAPVDEDVHHLGDAEAVAEVVKGVRSVGGLDAGEEVLQGGPGDAELVEEIEVVEHLLKEEDQLVLGVLPDVKVDSLEGHLQVVVDGQILGGLGGVAVGDLSGGLVHDVVGPRAVPETHNLRC